MSTQSDEPQVSGDERNMALISHALSFVEGGIVGPLILYLVKKWAWRTE